ncbi:MAG TPA: DNA recombination protein RmuC [Solirubrobacteraceae bacterium]|jgi:DNA recombination protein RmuC|nr:DNA recombination protein RmuC [Solirubrobacteraceae bacterium]
MLYILALLLLVLIALVAVLLQRQSRAAPARLDPGETERIVAALNSNIARVQGEIQKAGVEQLVAHNRSVLETQTARGEEQLKARQGVIDKGLAEVRKELGTLHELVREVDRRRGESIVKLETVTRESKQQTELLRSETGRLNEALSGSQTRGQWGERMAEDVLRVAGFIEGVQYRKQQQIAGGASRPDFTFFVQGQLLHMDVKTPMVEYTRYLEGATDQERDAAAKAFRRDVRMRIREVTTRDYIDPEGGTLDYMLVFIPNEQVYGFIHENDPQLLDEALHSKVVLCSPLTLFAILAVIRQASENFKLAQQTNEILRALGGFNKQWGMFKEQMSKVDRALESSRRAYADLMSTRTRQLDRQVERVDELRVAAGIEGGEPTEPALEEITASRALRAAG